MEYVRPALLVFYEYIVLIKVSLLISVLLVLLRFLACERVLQ
jgi:hypothetical protein